MERKKILVLTGAGISAESGLKTFRDGNGLWEHHRIEDVATPEAWQKNPNLVLRFYNQRRKDCALAQPNLAHKGLTTLEHQHEVVIITQNIDDLHERAGSSNIIHLHGEINKMRSELDDQKTYPYEKDILIGETAIDGGQFRPHVVWFGEAVPNIDTAFEYVHDWAEAIVLIGSSLAVYPAAGLLKYAPAGIPKYIIDKNIPDVAGLSNIIKIEKPATEGILDLMHFFQ